MKIQRKNKYANGLMALAVGLCNFNFCFAQDSAKHELLVNIGYYMTGNKMIYLMVHAKTKIDSKFQPVKNSIVSLYLDSTGDKNFIAKVTTGENGEAKTIIPPGLKTIWDASPVHTFLGIAEANKEFDETKTESPITKTKINIDTSSSDETRNVIVSVSELNNGKWLPAKDVEMKVGISRLGGILSAGDEALYTTDSTGTVTVEFKKDSLPGDEKGNIVLAAKVEDNDQYGNLLIEKTVPWGVSLNPDKNFFNQRTLWSTRFRTPLWLLFMAYSIVLGVWGVLIYLVLQIFKVKKIGRSSS